MRGRTLLIAGLLTAAYAGQAAAQITNSPHDLSGLDSPADNGEICVYCHTPHGSNTAVEAPLWNKPLVAQTYTAYDNAISTTIDGAIAVGGIGSVSIACLTCHDGTQAMDAVVNAPGAGNGTMTGTAGVNLISNAAGVSNGNADLGIDLSNDHPISIQYGGFEVAGAPIDPDFQQLALAGQDALETDNINGTNVWWVDTEGTGNGLRDKTDMILYTRSDQPYVECATCHDPHEGNGTATEVNFLRISNASSAVCLACHVK